VTSHCLSLIPTRVQHTQAVARTRAPTVPASSRGQLTMKRKGKPNVPINARGGYNNMMKAEEAMRAQRGATPANLPVFEIYCRTKRANMWYPCGSLGGDERSKVRSAAAGVCKGSGADAAAAAVVVPVCMRAVAALCGHVGVARQC
jgi:Family of unknown function (DUF6523)